MAVRELKIGKKFIQLEKRFTSPKKNKSKEKQVEQNVNIPSENLMRVLMDKIDSMENKTIIKNIYGESMES